MACSPCGNMGSLWFLHGSFTADIVKTKRFQSAGRHMRMLGPMKDGLGSHIGVLFGPYWSSYIGCMSSWFRRNVDSGSIFAPNARFPLQGPHKGALFRPIRLPQLVVPLGLGSDGT